MLRLLLASVALSLLASAASADFITGQVVDSFGVGVPGVDIDVKNLGGGGDPPISNDGTDANGNFLTTVPTGIYRVTFTPPPPPATDHLILEIEDVIIVGTTDLGVVQLPPGVTLEARLLTPGGLPVVGVNIDVIDETTGDDLTLVGDTTNVLGEFAIAVPSGPIELRVNTTPIVAPLLAPYQQALNLSADTDLGDVTLEAGFVVSATVLGPGGLPVDGADVDAIDLVTGEELFTPGDNSDGSGFVDFVVPAGSYDFQFCPTGGLILASAIVEDFVVVGSSSLGTVSMPAGMVLSGFVSDGLIGVPGDIDVRDPITQNSVPLCSDNIQPNGSYSVLVPAGTWNVTFTPPYSLMLGSSTSSSVAIFGNTVLNGVLPACPPPTALGAGQPGTGGVVPVIASSGGSTRLGNPGFTIDVTSGRGGARGFLWVTGLAANVVPMAGSGMLSSPGQLFGPDLLPFTLSGPIGLAGVGGASLHLPLPGAASLAGTSFIVRARIQDPNAAFGFSLTPKLHATLCQ